jgi:hypothetical protein
MEGKVLAILGTRCPEFSQHCSGRAGGAGFFGETKEFFIRQKFDRARVKSRGEHGGLWRRSVGEMAMTVRAPSCLFRIIVQHGAGGRQINGW